MAHTVDIGIFFIAKTELNLEESRKWLNHVGANEFELETLCKTDADALIELAGRRCYMSFQKGLNPNITKIRTDIAEYIENILSSGHGSVLEHASYSFAIEGVSRVFTGEMNRHRAGWAISEGSMRYIRFDDIGYWIPPSLQYRADDLNVRQGMNTEEMERGKLAYKQAQSQSVFQQAFEDAEKHYNELMEIWKNELAPESKFYLKKQITSMMRRIIPMGVATGGIWTGNLRAIRHVLTMRTSAAAEEEICFVFSSIMKKIAELEPNIFGDFAQDEHGFWKPKYVKV